MMNRSMRPWESVRPLEKAGQGLDFQDRMDQDVMIAERDEETVKSRFSVARSWGVVRIDSE